MWRNTQTASSMCGKKPPLGVEGGEGTAKKGGKTIDFADGEERILEPYYQEGVKNPPPSEKGSIPVEKVETPSGKKEWSCSRSSKRKPLLVGEKESEEKEFYSLRRDEAAGSASEKGLEKGWRVGRGKETLSSRKDRPEVAHRKVDSKLIVVALKRGKS